MLLWKKSLPGAFICQTRLQHLPQVAAHASDYHILERPSLFHQRLLELIGSARERIMMTLLYLQDDAAGREIMDALYAAVARNPSLHVTVYVDFHRAQRGLIGKGPQQGNSQMYLEYARGKDCVPAIYGVPVKKRELFGVMHLKGCVFDDTTLYSGASLNDVYLAHGGRYRLDRYHEIKSPELADAMCSWVTSAFHINYAVQDFSQGEVRGVVEIRDQIKRLRRHLTKMQYTVKDHRLGDGDIGITPLSGLGKRNNALNRSIIWLLGAARERLFICTPYFNPPRDVVMAIEAALARDVEVTLVVGDKVANDFYIKPGEPFSAVGGIPYIYEQNLRSFLAAHQECIDSGQLNVMLWRDGDNTYHLKGIYVDDRYALITGNNLNPRAWGLDLENGLIVHDPHHLLQEKFMHEQQYILRHATRLTSCDQLETLEDYPEHIRKLLTKVKRFKASILIKHLL
ncbi:MAG: CDP-diacylglycerol--serine O-phosphatidyltransferase [Succinivibrionaceae bacterium]|nr:CDP-diacylglycerol--serine O-phosphatidyltransferase [Succinivibrionaceae bacterium]